MKFLNASVAAASALVLTTTATGHGTGGDCRNQTWRSRGGVLDILSWHIHYTSNSSEFPRFYQAFAKEFRALFPPTSEGDRCPFGPNFGNLEDRSYPYVCSLEDAIGEGQTVQSEEDGGEGPWTVSQRAFYVRFGQSET